jgi:hypothetical protein
MNTSTDTCPSLEDLAAFLDGKLSGDERARVVAHLADCPRCYEVFAETARFQLYEEEDEDADPPEMPIEDVMVEPLSTVVPFPRTQVFRWVSSIAAVLAIAIVAVTVYRQYMRTMPEVASAQLVEHLAADTGKARPWTQGDMRGGGEPEDALDYEPTEFLVGVHLVDLRMALAQNEKQAAIDALSRINANIGGLLFVGESAKFYENAIARIDQQGQEPKSLIQEADLEEHKLEEVTSWPLAFGKWAEAGRLSALAQNSSFFQEGANRKFLGWLLQNKDSEDTSLDPAVVKALEDIRATLGESDPSSLPYKDLQGLFEKILTYYQKESTESEPG